MLHGEADAREFLEVYCCETGKPRRKNNGFTLEKKKWYVLRIVNKQRLVTKVADTSVALIASQTNAGLPHHPAQLPE